MKYKKIVKAICFAIIFIMLFVTANNVLIYKDNAYKVKSFYELPKNSCDVIFIGSSTMLTAVQPMEIWNKYGITSYNLAQHGQSFPITYYMLQEAIRYQHPKVVVIDVHTIYRNDKDFSIEYAHLTLDNVPLSINKIMAVNDVIQDDKRLEFILPITKYHTRWKELTAKEFEKTEDVWRGTYMRGGLKTFDKLATVKEDDVKELNDIGTEYLKKIINTCKEQGIQLILTNMPWVSLEGSRPNVQKMQNYVKNIADESNIPYLNFTYINDVGIDTKNDFCDYEHLNYKGALKITDYLADYLNENYSLTDYRNDSKYAEWNNDYKKYLEYKTAFLKSFDKSYKK